MAIFEATIDQIDYRTGKCTIKRRGVSAGGADLIQNIPIPNIAGADDTGLFLKWKRGTVVVVSSSESSSNSVPKILATIPSSFLYENSSQDRPSDTPAGVVDYPHIDHDADDPFTPNIAMHGGVGSRVEIHPKGHINLTTNKKTGLFLYNEKLCGTQYNIAGNFHDYSNAHRSWSGPIKRMKSSFKSIYSPPTTRDHPMLVDIHAHKGGIMGGIRDIALFSKTAAWNLAATSKGGGLNQQRNPRLAESVTKYYEFTSESMFSGFDDEVKRVSGEIDHNMTNTHRFRDRVPGNILHMPEKELVEVIVGNVVDINGKMLDINFNPVVVGGPGGSFPIDDLRVFDEKMLEVKRKTRRGIGYHFQLSTNSSINDPSSSQTNFVFNIDKEGIFKLNVPKSSKTGNVPFASNTEFLTDGDSTAVSYKNPSKSEPVPVTLRKKDGTTQFPTVCGGGGSDSTPAGTRLTGVEYVNLGESRYFPSSGDEPNRVRVNHTAYHNMYSIAERVIANTIQRIHVPPYGLNRLGALPAESGAFPFEIPNDDSVESYNFMTCVGVAPGKPGMHPGGAEPTLSVVGRDQQSYPAYSNSFQVKKIDDNNISQIMGVGEEEVVCDSGGKSANINFEGAVDLSVGSDNFDKKSLVLDTESTVLAWLGKPPKTSGTDDVSDRSLVLQTDGSILVNVGGTYSGEYSGNKNDLESSVNPPVFNKGRLDIRVNVSDKGFVAGREPDELESDYLISISEHGIIIAGMAKERPMVIRNTGDISIESTSKLVLNGGKGGVSFVEPSGELQKLASLKRP